MESTAPLGTGPRTEAPHLAAPTATGEYVFEPFRLNVPAMQLWRGDDLVTITPKAFDTLLVLIANRDRLVRKEELLAAVWPNSFVSEDSLAQNITVLRRTLGDDPNQPHFIATVPRRGYRFIAPVTEHHRHSEPAPAIVDNPPEQPRSHAEPAPAPVPAWRQPAVRLALAGAAAMGILAFGLGRSFVPSGDPAGQVLNLSIDPPSGTRLASGGVLSPDESSLAFIGQDETTGTQRIWIRLLETGAVRSLEGTEGASRPFWSPDGKSIGFFANSKVKRIDAAGGPVQTLADYIGLTNSGASWGDDVILFASFKTGLFAVPATGGKVTPVTELDTSGGEIAHRWPQFLPDLRHFIYSVNADSAQRSGVYVGSLDSKDHAKLLDESAAFFEPSGHLLFIRDRVLLAQPFDRVELKLSGTPQPIAGDVSNPTNNNNSVVSASPSLLAYGGTPGDHHLLWVDRNGRALTRLEAPPALSNPTLALDQTRAVAGNGTEVWLLDLERDGATLVGPGATPLLWPTGDQIAYTNPGKDGISDIYVRATSGPPHQTLVLHTGENKFVNDITRDGRYMVFSSLNAQTKMDLWVLPLQGEKTPSQFLATQANEFQAQVSPDGRWVAYSSEESGTWEVYVQSFPQPGAKRAISTGGGSEPQWRRDGRELFYLAPDGTLMSVDIQSTANDIRVSRRRPLFRTPIPISGELNMRRNHYVPSSDGQRFLMNASDETQRTIHVLVNWKKTLNQ